MKSALDRSEECIQQKVLWMSMESALDLSEECTGSQ